MFSYFRWGTRKAEEMGVGEWVKKEGEIIGEFAQFMLEVCFLNDHYSYC